MRIAIIGANGFLGNKLVEYFSKDNQVISASLKPLKGIISLDATKDKEVQDFFLKYKPEVVVDTVALTSSVRCEKEPKLCRKLNYETARIIAKYCKKEKSKLVFVSSSYIFDGTKGNYSETDIPHPKNEYARNKVLAERCVSELPNSIIIRIDLLYGVYKGNIRFGTRILDGKPLEVGYPNQLRSPLFINDVPRVLSELIEKNQSGIYNIAGPEKITMAHFLKKVSEFCKPKPELKIVDASEWIVKSPGNSDLDILKMESLGIKTTSLKESLKKIRKDLNQVHPQSSVEGGAR